MTNLPVSGDRDALDPTSIYHCAACHTPHKEDDLDTYGLCTTCDQAIETALTSTHPTGDPDIPF